MSDPFWAALQPPPNESPADRDRRLFAEFEAKRVSDGIDEMLRQERKELRMKQEVKILLLGQSESGKSTTLKREILDAVSPDTEDDDNDELDSTPRPRHSHRQGTQIAKYEQYRQALEPLKELEERLIRMLSSPDEDEPTRIPTARTEWNGGTTGFSTQGIVTKNGRPTPVITIPVSRQPSFPLSPASPSTSSPGGSSSGSSKSKQSEVSVHPRSNWKKAFSLGNKIKSPKSAHTNEIEGWWDDPSDPVHVLNSCAQPMLALWKDTSVKQRLRERGLRIEESSGFFLDEITRITALRYFPTDQDVLNARLKTMGVVEHTFSIPDSQRSMDWKIYDVGGARNQRHAWAPYFEDVNAIIFLAPISAFDQVLVEDPKVNRLEDSFLLWRSLVSNKLLMDVSIILFLNKIDLLQAKLKAGVRLKDYIMQYGDRPNDFDNISKCE
ncbi:guanine nucleotide binding protein, alpha subunit [Butyriboletus roseoflavus]|nr:guanine nucleotide binding protein, alpha subunit [Butyriboletus roseoflavus]